MKVSLAEARRLLLAAQGLESNWKLPPGTEGAAQVVERLGYVQIDTIAVIERAHHHVIWTRHPGYKAAHLDDLLSRERRVFEYWAHAAAYLPMRDYRYYLPRIRYFAEEHRARHWLAENRALAKKVLGRIAAEGPLGTADFEHKGEQRGPWWDWKPAKRALEYLFWSGKLMIAGRRNFQRLYDLSERVLPPNLDTSAPRPEESARFVARRALQSQGLTTAKQKDEGLSDTKRVGRALAELTEAGEAVRVQVEGLEKETFFAWNPLLAAPRSRRRQLHLLSPFDNLVIDRRRTARFFDFEYRIECYTPAPKRKYGYFTLPILWGDELVGRLDPKAERQEGVFRVKKLVLEPGFTPGEVFCQALARKLRAFTTFHGCDEVLVEATQPAGVRAALRRALKG
ncbi:MAG: YcaQ family DNA glycosylase [Candidatus Latescibacteria bacterium]|nr:YcaQ family DNA glycosylase [Candidatus Latescibacterota bacterium]